MQKQEKPSQQNPKSKKDKKQAEDELVIRFIVFSKLFLE